MTCSFPGTGTRPDFGSWGFDGPGLSLVMAVYCEGDRLLREIPEVISVFTRSGLDWEMVLVDDHSPDSTLKRLKDIRGLAPQRIQIRSMKRNSGQIPALLTGITLATKEWVLTFDVDSVPALVQLPRLLSGLSGGPCDLFNWSRAGQRNISLPRRMGSTVMAWLTRRITGLTVEDPLSPLKLGRRSLFLAVLKDPIKRHFPAPLTLMKADHPQEGRLPLPPRRDRSKFGWSGLLRLMMVFTGAYPSRLVPGLFFSGVLLGWLTCLIATVFWLLIHNASPPSIVILASLALPPVVLLVFLGLTAMAGRRIIQGQDQQFMGRQPNFKDERKTDSQ